MVSSCTDEWLIKCINKAVPVRFCALKEGYMWPYVVCWWTFPREMAIYMKIQMLLLESQINYFHWKQCVAVDMVREKCSFLFNVLIAGDENKTF